MTKYVLDDEPAQDQLDLLLDFYDVEVEEIEETAAYYNDGEDDVQRAIKGACKRLKRFIRKGLVEVTEENGLTITQRLKCPIGNLERVTYRVIDGQAKQEMRWAKENDFYGKIYYLMGALSKIPANTIAKFKAVDSAVVECLGAIFLTA